MSKAKVVLPKSSINGTKKVAGDLERFSGGQQTYLAPLPLPTFLPVEYFSLLRSA